MGEVEESGPKGGDEKEEDPVVNESQEMLLEDMEKGEVSPSCQKRSKLQRFRLVVATRKCVRMAKKPRSSIPAGITPSPHNNNSFTILNSCDDTYLEEIAEEWDICLGNNAEEVLETISTMKLEELARANLAEANYKCHLEKKLQDQHVLQGENLDLQPTDNVQRGAQNEIMVRSKTVK